MLDLTAPTSSRTPDPSGACPTETDRHVATRARLAASDGVLLHYRSWRPVGERPAGVLLFLHGIASHGAWISETAAYLAERGFATYAPDRRGSGLSGGPRGHVDSYEQALGDLDRFLDLIVDEQPDRPIFLVGSSWAAKLAVACAARSQGRLTGLLLHGPGLFPRVDLGLSQKLAVLVHHRSDPHRQIPIPLTPENYTRNPRYLEYIRQDGYRLLTASSSFFWETRQLDRARDRFGATLTLPILLQIGADDPIMDPTASCRWVHTLTAPDRVAIVYRNASHTLDFEPEPTLRAYRADLLGWLRRQIAKGVSHGR